MPKFAVIIRHLPNSRPVTCGIIDESKDPQVDDMDHYLYAMANDKIRLFKQHFVEFKAATWYVDLMEDYSNTPYDTKIIPPEF